MYTYIHNHHGLVRVRVDTICFTFIRPSTRYNPPPLYAYVYMFMHTYMYIYICTPHGLIRVRVDAICVAFIHPNPYPPILSPIPKPNL
jgi:hypothetical protein